MTSSQTSYKKQRTDNEIDALFLYLIDWQILFETKLSTFKIKELLRIS